MNAVLKGSVSVLERQERPTPPSPDDKALALPDQAGFRSLFDRYARVREEIEQTARFMAEGSADVVPYFLNGNLRDRMRYTVSSGTVAEIFATKGAIAELDAECWQQAMDLTELYELMPENKRHAWAESIRERSTPKFTRQNVIATLGEMWAGRERLAAERVDGLFTALSGQHVTNRPEGFSKRMIVAGIFSDYGFAYSHESGYIHDLRCVIARFMGRDQPDRGHTAEALRYCRAETGVWRSFDGGALRMRSYKCGTVHIEVHPEMAWRLNNLLALLHPQAIPASFRSPSKTKRHTPPLMNDLLDFTVLRALSQAPIRIDEASQSWLVQTGLRTEGKAHVEKVHQALAAVGGSIETGERHLARVRFDFDPSELIAKVCASGAIPDQRSHQFYPTPRAIAEAVIEAAEIGARDRCLEPSAGLGNIAQFLPVARTNCVEVSPLRCTVLRKRGFEVTQADFIDWGGQKSACPRCFDRIVMNPPYSEGRWQAHTITAAGLLADGGRLVAVLPESARGKTLVEDFRHEWLSFEGYEVAREGKIPGTSIRVCVLILEPNT